MIPLRDNIPSRRRPVVTYALIAANVFVYLFLQPGLQTRQGILFLHLWGLVPADLLGAAPLVRHPVPVSWTVITSMFVHGGLFHILGNMWYLWLFGDNVEDAMGRGRFLVFYLLSGVAAAAAQVFVGPSSRVPMVGASGAISGVLGGYLLLYPHARILTLIPMGFFLPLLEIPAVIVLGFWIVVQVFNGFVTFTWQGGGVAWFAHVGGFVAGMLLVRLFRGRRPRLRRVD